MRKENLFVNGEKIIKVVVTTAWIIHAGVIWPMGEVILSPIKLSRELKEIGYGKKAIANAVLQGGLTGLGIGSALLEGGSAETMLFRSVATYGAVCLESMALRGSLRDGVSRSEAVLRDIARAKYIEQEFRVDPED